MKRHHKGFTIIHLIIGMLILSILVAAVACIPSTHHVPFMIIH